MKEIASLVIIVIIESLELEFSHSNIIHGKDQKICFLHMPPG